MNTHSFIAYVETNYIYEYIAEDVERKVRCFKL